MKFRVNPEKLRETDKETNKNRIILDRAKIVVYLFIYIVILQQTANITIIIQAYIKLKVYISIKLYIL